MGATRGTAVPRKIIGAWLFPAAVAALYAATALFSPAIAAQALKSFGALLANITPAMVLVFCLIFLTNLFIDRRWLARHLGKTSGVRGWVFAIVAGILSAGPLYAWYPLLGDLKAKGMRGELIAAFLYARALKLPLLPLMVQYFGMAFTVTLSLCIIVFSVISGLLVKAIPGIEDADAGGNR
ncbi:MAG TPA: permease [Rhodobacteraceae bacterium]|nr:permease [Paracoccaceae bacterium]